jgi:hypothetical protein
MNRKRSWITLLLGAIALGFSCLSSLSFAEQQTLKATMSWDAQGTVYVVGPDKLLFQGAMAGVFYVEKASGKLNAAFGLCPVEYTANKKEKTTSGFGQCEIIGEGGDSVFAEYSCSGTPGLCKGTFTITGGTGSLKGAEGASDMIIRSTISELVLGLGSGSEIAVKNGIMILPKLTYTVPGQ